MGKFTFFSFVSEQWTRLPPPLSADLSGKTVVVTGSNAGIGLEAAKHFARMKPARLIVACRSEERGKAALEHIAHKTGYKAELQLVDFADFSSVEAFAARLGDDPVDYLVANAAVAQGTFLETKDGWEQTIQVNHLSTALLSLLLLPNMASAAQKHQCNSRLVIVTSEVHFLVDIGNELQSSSKGILRTLSDREFCTPARFSKRYEESKLLNVLFVRALSAHLDAALPIVPTGVNPGFCRTTFRKNLPLGTRIITGIMDVMLGRTPEQGSRQLIHAALGPDGKDGPHVKIMRGAYISCNALQEPSDFVVSKEGYDVQERIWRETTDILSETSPAAREVLKQYFQGRD
ncbi:NAD(P)-dependent dehydrogenase [Phanerochaete sordida]|uniref:NAD(P)-dependent dehydrogenase n=1 Tax=Phanerochaete sordida TaxID=48140 RepID=A0A9P3G535_9APHY|nr:NAD(P)-dependent dehydrogenase [Phanerochaete sordida]